MLKKSNNKISSDEIISMLDSIGAKETILHSEQNHDITIHDICEQNKDEDLKIINIINKDCKICKAIYIMVGYYWNEQTWPNLIDFRRRCRNELGYELILADIEMWQSLLGNMLYLDPRKANTIRKICKHYNISFKGLTNNTRGVLLFIGEDVYYELNNRQFRGIKKIKKYIRKHINPYFDCYTYYEDNNIQNKYQYHYEIKKQQRI